MNLAEHRKIAWVGKEDKIHSDRLYSIERKMSSIISWSLLKIFPQLNPNLATFLSLGCLGLSFILVILSWYGLVDFRLAFLANLIFLYLISIIDKIDGELARVTGKQTQVGLYYDRSVHFFYPVIFYLSVGTYFLAINPSPLMFFITIITGLFTQQLIFFREALLLIGDKIKTTKIRFIDHKNEVPAKKKRLPFVLRLVDYTTFMIYSFTLFFYLALLVVSLVSPPIAYGLYVAHIIISLTVNFYKSFISYPSRKLYSQAQADELLSL